LRGADKGEGDKVNGAPFIRTVVSWDDDGKGGVPKWRLFPFAIYYKGVKESGNSVLEGLKTFDAEASSSSLPLGSIGGKEE